MESFIDHVAGHAGISDAEAEHVTRAMLRGLGAYLTAPTRAMISEELPEGLADALVGGNTALPLEELVRMPHTTAGEARELVASVCHVLGEELSDDCLQLLRAELPATTARMLDVTSVDIARHSAPARRSSTLVTGRPGSEHPVSEGRPPEAQVGSVGERNPHAETKLSSSSGTQQERVHKTLAEGQPGPDEPLANRR